MPIARPVLDSSSPCPCGSGRLFSVCCEPVLKGARVAETAEELMRARFTAHVIGDYEFLHHTYEGTAGTKYVPEQGEAAETWTKLVVNSHTPGRTSDQAFVDFSAHFTQDGAAGVLHEKAEFARQEGKWIYTRAVRIGPAPVAAAPKVGRNDPCPCGSGKKYKHCCLLKSA